MMQLIHLIHLIRLIHLINLLHLEKYVVDSEAETFHWKALAVVEIWK